MSRRAEAGRFATRAVHGGLGPDAATGAVNTPISLSSTFAQDGVGGHQGYDYGRSGNPSRSALEQHLALLEGAAMGLCFASGLAAEDAILRLCRPGDHVLLSNDAYGGTWRLVSKVHAPAGLQFSTVDLCDLEAVEAAIQPNTKLVWVETPTNPLLRVVDIAAVAELAHRRGAACVVDNTFATPYLQQPLSLGADVVLHSTTKYVSGHSDVIGGFCATNDREVGEQLAFLQNSAGAVPSPLDCYLLQRGVKTLAVRLDRSCASALEVVELLLGHPSVCEVLHPSLPEHPGHRAAARQMSQFGAMVSFRCSGGEAAALAVCAATEIFTLAESLGAVESLIEHPGKMTHASVAGSSNEVPADLVRLSIGLEDPADLLEDLSQALEAAAT